MLLDYCIVLIDDFQNGVYSAFTDHRVHLRIQLIHLRIEGRVLPHTDLPLELLELLEHSVLHGLFPVSLVAQCVLFEVLQHSSDEVIGHRLELLQINLY